ncbi:hypothetical protein ACXXGU_10500, partial [Staphylococcus epidermidis]
IRKVTAQRAENNQKNYKKDNFYIISIEIVFFHLSRYFMSRTLLCIFEKMQTEAKQSMIVSGSYAFLKKCKFKKHKNDFLV